MKVKGMSQRNVLCLSLKMLFEGEKEDDKEMNHMIVSFEFLSVVVKTDNFLPKHR